MSPKEQLDIMYSQEEKMRAMQTEPNEKDLEASINKSINERISCWLESFEPPFSDTLLILTLLTQRYMYYIKTGVPTSMLAPQPRQQMKNIICRLPPDAKDSKHLQIMRANMEEEVKRDYYFSLKESIGMKQ